MRKLTTISFIIIVITLLYSCNKNSGDDWTLKKIISLGHVSITVPETYEFSKKSSSDIVVDNGFDGSSVEIIKEAVNAQTQDDIFNYKKTHYAYGTPTVSDTTLLGIQTLKLSTIIEIAPGLGGEHYMNTFIFIDHDYVYTIEFAWSSENNEASLNLMNQMLATLAII
jgi:hypothetical protein